MTNHQGTKTPRNTKGEKMKAMPVSANEDHIGKDIVDAAYTVHRALGPGLLEHVYEVCFCHELSKRSLSFQQQVAVPLVYEGVRF